MKNADLNKYVIERLSEGWTPEQILMLSAITTEDIIVTMNKRRENA